MKEDPNEYYRQPDGSVVSDSNTHGLAWKNVWDRAEAIFEGYEVDCVFRENGLTSIKMIKWEKNIIIENITITIPALELLERKINHKE